MTPVPTTWLTQREAAAYAKTTPITLTRAVKRGYLKVFRLVGGTRLRYRTSDLDAWLSASPVVRP